MKKFLSLLSGLLFLVWGAMAQEFPQEIGAFNTGNFPEISFTYTCYDKPLNRGEITLTTGSERIRVEKVEQLQNPHLSEPSYVLFLWEDMYVNGDMDAFVREVLEEVFMAKSVSSQDKFAIATFNRTPAGSSVLKMQTVGFISDRSLLYNKVQNYVRSTKVDYEKPSGRTDVYRALKEGIVLLDAQKGRGAKSIVLFTAGNPLEEPTVSGAGSMHDVLMMAKSRHIPIGVMQYHVGRGNVDIGLIAEETHGIQWFETGETKEDAARMLVSTGLVQQQKAYGGYTYKIMFTAPFKRGSDAQTVRFKAGNRVELSGQIVPPPFSIKAWLEENIDVVFCVSAVLLIVLIGGLWRICRNVRRRKTEEGNDLGQGGTPESGGQSIPPSSSDTGSQRMDEQKRLEDIMRTKNMYPRLQYMENSNTRTYTVQKARISIGRQKDNDFVLSQRTVSGYHCEIYFDGLMFHIRDKNSKNKVIVNGIVQNQCALKSGDVIELGEVVVLFMV